MPHIWLGSLCRYGVALLVKGLAVNKVGHRHVQDAVRRGLLLLRVPCLLGGTLHHHGPCFFRQLAQWQGTGRTRSDWGDSPKKRVEVEDDAVEEERGGGALVEEAEVEVAPWLAGTPAAGSEVTKPPETFQVRPAARGYVWVPFCAAHLWWA